MPSVGGLDKEDGSVIKANSLLLFLSKCFHNVFFDIFRPKYREKLTAIHMNDAQDKSRLAACKSKLKSTGQDYLGDA